LEEPILIDSSSRCSVVVTHQFVKVAPKHCWETPQHLANGWPHYVRRQCPTQDTRPLTLGIEPINPERGEAPSYELAAGLPGRILLPLRVAH
jgi:hypothetical protein